MAMKLKRKITWPIPMDKKYEFIRERLEIQEDASRFRLINNRYLPPCTFLYSTYKTCAQKLHSPLKEADLVRQKKLVLITERVKEQINNAKTKLKDLFLSYQQMVMNDNKELDRSLKMLIEDMDTFKNLKKIYRRCVMACHSLLYIKDSMEEAVETYGDAASFMKEVLRRSETGENVYDIQQKYKELTNLKSKVGEEVKQEMDKHSAVIDGLLKKYGEYHKEATLIHIKGKELDTALRDLDCRISTEEQFMSAAHSWNERAWRHYSFINFTLFDILKYLVEARDHSPKVLQVSLWDKMEFIRREHRYNLEILKRCGVTHPKIDIKKLMRTDVKLERIKKKEDAHDKIVMKKLREVKNKFKGDVPKVYKLLFRKLRLRLSGTTKTGQELLKMISPSERNVFEQPITETPFDFLTDYNLKPDTKK